MKDEVRKDQGGIGSGRDGTARLPSSSIPHPSSFIFHPSSFILHRLPGCRLRMRDVGPHQRHALVEFRAQTANAQPHCRRLDRHRLVSAGPSRCPRLRRPGDVLRRGRTETGGRRRRLHCAGLRRYRRQIQPRPQPRLRGKEIRHPGRPVAAALQQVGAGPLLQFLAAVGRGWRQPAENLHGLPVRAAQGKADRLASLAPYSAGGQTRGKQDKTDERGDRRRGVAAGRHGPGAAGELRGPSARRRVAGTDADDDHRRPPQLRPTRCCRGQPIASPALILRRPSAGTYFAGPCFSARAGFFGLLWEPAAGR